MIAGAGDFQRKKKSSIYVSILVADLILIITTVMFTLSFEFVFGPLIIKGHNVLYLAIFIELLIFIGILFTGGTQINRDKPDLSVIECIKQHYEPQEMGKEFEDFEWKIKKGDAIVINYLGQRWYIQIIVNELAIISHCKAKCADIHVFRMLDSINFSEYKRKKEKPPHKEILFRKLIPNINMPDVKMSKFGKYYMCGDEESCHLAEEIIDYLSRAHSICGVSLTGVFSIKFVGICAKIPKSEMEFESVLSFASEMKNMLCED